MAVHPTQAQSMRTLLDTAIGNLQINKEKAFEFFVVYARYEYAIKVCHYVEQPGHQNDLKISYKAIADAVARNFGDRLARVEALAVAVNYYENFPPKKQIWDPDKKGPDWRTVEYSEGSVHKILLQLAQTRNNLFHGGKGWSADDQTLGRDNQLVSHGLVILNEIINSDENLAQSFSSYQ